MHNEALHDLYSSSPVVKVMKARSLRWEIGEMPTGFWWGNLKERDKSEDPCLDGRIIIKCILKQGVNRICLTDDRGQG